MVTVDEERGNGVCAGIFEVPWPATTYSGTPDRFVADRVTARVMSAYRRQRLPGGAVVLEKQQVAVLAERIGAAVRG